ncbi:unnamed protein product [Boreogadus saida]
MALIPNQFLPLQIQRIDYQPPLEWSENPQCMMSPCDILYHRITDDQSRRERSARGLTHRPEVVTAEPSQDAQRAEGARSPLLLPGGPPGVSLLSCSAAPVIHDFSLDGQFPKPRGPGGDPVSTHNT